MLCGFEPGVSLEATSPFLRGRGKVVYILPSSDPTLALLLAGFTEYDDDDALRLFSRNRNAASSETPNLIIACLYLT
ncbi:hypothetical protein Hanom_Chr14g01314961 [Helianthus anomalus]